MKKLLYSLMLSSVATTATALDFKVVKDIPYAPHQRCTLDVRYPIGVSNCAVVVNFHGGGLTSGNKCHAPWPHERWDRDPVCFIAANYRFLTNATPDECISDAAHAVAWSLRHAAEFSGASNKVFVTGTSAGGYLTAMLGLDPSRLAAVGFKPTDLAGILPLTGQMTKHFNVRKISFDDRTPQYRPIVDSYAPLAFASGKNVPPACFLTGGRDVEWPARVEENELLYASMRALGNRRVEFQETEGSHGASVIGAAGFLRDFVLKTVDTAAVSRFAKREHIAFFGDSITHDGRYVGYLQLFAALRHPGWNIRCYNTGISGDVAAGGITRWNWDVLSFKPDRVFVMFGMNDVGRDNYNSNTPTPAQAKARANSLAWYEQSQSKLADMILASQVKAVMLTPSPYDQYSDAAAKNLVSCNEPGLAACAKTCRQIADRHLLGRVDFHDRLTAILKVHPELHLCGNDRVHPRSEGHLLMAALILEEMGEDPLVARVVIDAKKGAIAEIGKEGTRNAKARACVATRDCVSFTYEPKALPFPALAEYLADEKLYPLTQRFNQEIICVTGLDEGYYSLCFDDDKIGVFSASDFANGVNVALLPTPNQKQAKATADLVRKLVANESDRRYLVLNYRDFKPAKIALDDYAAQDALIDKKLAKMKADKCQWYNAHVNIANNYRRNRARAKELDFIAENLFERINAVRPAISRVTIRKEKH